MRAIKLLLIFVLCSVLMGCCCNTIPRLNVARVCYFGNIHTSRPAVENDVLYKCAQITLAQGFDFFIIGPTDTSPSYHPTITPCTICLDDRGSVPCSYRYSHKLLSSVTIKMYCGRKPDDLPNTYDARAVCNYQHFNGAWFPLR